MLIYIDNLSLETTEADLRSVFEVFGQVRRTQIMKNGTSGESRGFGFVDMPTKAEAKEAIEILSCTDPKGRALIIK